MIETPRLLIRTWRPEDRDAFVALCGSPEVMTHLGGPQAPEDVDAAIGRIQDCQSRNGFCFWAVERKEDHAFLGFCGMKIADDPGTPIDGEVEIGWRLRADEWGQGYAREAAAACLQWAWANLEVDRIVAITVAGNSRSWGLMERLGLERRPDMDFDHPHFPPGHALRPHVTYVAERPL
jgi:RimJ/RimL family protein N-acetyltransferase